MLIIVNKNHDTFRTLHVEEYKEEVLKHLQERAAEIPRERLVQIWNNCWTTCENNKHLISSREEGFIKEKIESHSIPAPKICNAASPVTTQSVTLHPLSQPDP